MKVRSGIPVPEQRFARNRKYPFHEMDPGDSVEFDDTDTFNKARRAAQSYAKVHGVEFTSRKGIQDGEFTGHGGTIWRKT